MVETDNGMKDKMVTWEELEKLPKQAIIDSISIAIGELERRGITESEIDGLIVISVLIEKLCLKGQCRCRTGKEGETLKDKGG